jgi:amidohydrolase
MTNTFKFKIAVLFFCVLQNGAILAQDSVNENFALGIYKSLHQHPELGMKEFKTAERIRQELKAMGFTNFVEVAGLPTAVIAVVEMKKAGKTSCFRADIDALPINETTGLPYTSQVDSVMHSCGHDAHTAILLTTAQWVMKNRNKLSGKIVFLFQPAEEIAGGADDIVRSGVLQKLGVQQCFALHVNTNLPTGNFAISEGYMLAGSNYFSVLLNGKQSHASKPYEGDNVPQVAAQLVSEINAIPAVALNPANRPAVVAVTSFRTLGTSAANIIAPSAQINGTIRAFEVVDSMFSNKKNIAAILHETVQRSCYPNVNFDIKIRKNNPPLYNHPQLFRQTIPNLVAKYGNKLDTSHYQGTGSEDFSYIAQVFPSLYFLLGVKGNGMGNSGAHTPEFTIDTQALNEGVGLFTKIISLHH